MTSASGGSGRQSPSALPGLSAGLAQRAESLFSLLDTGGCGYLCQEDLARCCGDDINVAAVFAQLDTDGDGRIDAADFQSAIGLLLTAGSTANAAAPSRGEQQLPQSQLCSKSYSQEDGLDVEPPASPSPFDNIDEESVGQLTCRDQVSELHRQLGRQCPQLLDTFELVMASVARDVGAQARERRELEASYQRARAENERHVRQLEEEAEAQMARMEQLARERERRRLEDEYQELLRTKEREVGQLRQMMEVMQAESVKAGGASEDRRNKRQHQRRRRWKPEAGSADEHLEEDADSPPEGADEALSSSAAGPGRLMAEMRQLETALALSSSEVARLRQDRDDGERELQLERGRLREHQREQERLTRQLQQLHDANRSLNDTNDSLRAALERQRSVASSVVSMSGSASAAALSVLDLSQPHEAVLPAFDTCEEDDDPNYLLAAAEADSGTSTFREPPNVDSSGGSAGGGGGGGGGSVMFGDAEDGRRGNTRRSHLSGLSDWGDDSDQSVSEESDSDDDDSQLVAREASTVIRPSSLALNLQRRRRRRRRGVDHSFSDEITDEGGESSGDGAARRRVVRALSRSPRIPSDADDAGVDGPDEEPSSRPTAPSTPSPLGEPERMFRIVMAGDAAVGKTCFITRFCEGRFDSGAVSTLGVDFKTRTVKVDGHVIAVQLWDTAGQERFRSIAKSYFRRADGVILVYDCTSDRSFVSVRDWVESIKDSCGGDSSDVPIMIVANKTDLREAARQRTGAAQRVIETDEGRRLAELFSAAIFVEVSARNGANVNSSVLDLCRLLQQREDLAVSKAAADAALELHANGGDGRALKKRLPACCP